MTQRRRRVFVRAILSSLACLLSLYSLGGMAMSADFYTSSRGRQFEVGVVVWGVVMVLSLMTGIALAGLYSEGCSKGTRRLSA